MNQPESNRSSFRFSLSCLLAAVTMIAGCLGGCLALINWSEGEFEIATIDCGSGREIVITAARSWEISQPIYYFVRVDGDVVVPTTCFDNNAPDNDPKTLRFTHFTTADGDLVGVTYADDPSNYLIVHDFSEGASWPRGDHIDWSPKLSADDNREARYKSRADMEAKLDASRSVDSTGG